jgi:hypothetical protein
MTSVFDLFTDVQADATTILSSGSTHWGPTTSSKQLTSSGTGQTQSISGGLWHLSSINSGSVFLIQYERIGAGGFDFSGTPTIKITLTSGDLTFLSNLRLTLVDSSSNSHSSSGTTLLTSVTWTLMTDFPGVDLTSITTWVFGTSSPLFRAITATFDPISSLVVCVAKDTQILMADQSIKLIQDIQRGEFVAGDSQSSIIHQVARVNIQSLAATHSNNFVVFDVNSVGPNQPYEKLIITENHPIVYNNARRPAYCFQNYPGVTYYKDVSASEILPVNNDTCTVYDLQFDHEGTYVANGLIVQSRSPRSNLTPLPEELYFDPTLYTDEKVNDCYDHIFPLNVSIL